MLKIFNILYFFNETIWQDDKSLVTDKLYYFNDKSKNIMNFYYINWLKEYVEATKNETVHAVVRIWD